MSGSFCLLNRRCASNNICQIIISVQRARDFWKKIYQVEQRARVLKIKSSWVEPKLLKQKLGWAELSQKTWNGGKYGIELCQVKPNKWSQMSFISKRSDDINGIITEAKGRLSPRRAVAAITLGGASIFCNKFYEIYSKLFLCPAKA